MKNPLYSNEPKDWSSLSLCDQIEAIRKHLCTGPCGQSSQVMQQRQRIDVALTTAREVIAGFVDVVNEAGIV